MTTSERQKSRVTAPVGVLLKIGDTQEACFTRNISVGGTFVMTKRNAAIDEDVTLSFVHAGQRLSTEARVASITDAGLGIRFITPSEEFCAGVNALISDLLQKGDEHTPNPSHQPGGTASWSYIPQKGLLNVLRRRKRMATLSGLSLDGAALESRHRPDIDQEVLIFLKSPDINEDLECRAKVVRHTGRGFAVQFETPSVMFRRTISDLRRNGALA